MSDLQLDTLEARGLIRVASLQPELEYLFRHALLQDTAYESLLKQERRALHQLVGQTLEDLYPDRAGELAAVLAMHFEQAGDTDKAIEYLAAAARFARDRNAIVEGFDLFSRAAALLPPRSDSDDEASLRRRIEIELGRARVGFAFVSEGDALTILEPLVADSKRLGDLRLEADVHLTIALLRQFRGERPEESDPLRRSLSRVREIARELDDPMIAALPESIVGLFQIFTGQLRDGIEILERVAPQLAEKRDFVGSSFALVALAIGYARLGEFDKAQAAATRATEVGEDGDLIAKLDALIGESTVRSLRGDLDEAVPLARRCTELAEETGATACVVASNFLLGDSYMRQGRYGDAKIAFERGSEVASAIDQVQFRPSIAAYMRSNAASLGELRDDTRSFEAALAETRRIHDRWGEANVIWKRAETEAKLSDGNRAQMVADYAEAAAAFEMMGAQPYHARVLRGWGLALREIGRTDDGNEKLNEALSVFDELGITREADDLRALLAGSTES
jgi:tetratricopeptide (TPR) repeat protein